jgi:hypothetical protein
MLVIGVVTVVMVMVMVMVTIRLHNLRRRSPGWGCRL